MPVFQGARNGVKGNLSDLYAHRLSLLQDDSATRLVAYHRARKRDTRLAKLGLQVPDAETVQAQLKMKFEVRKAKKRAARIAERRDSRAWRHEAKI